MIYTYYLSINLNTALNSNVYCLEIILELILSVCTSVTTCRYVEKQYFCYVMLMIFFFGWLNFNVIFTSGMAKLQNWAMPYNSPPPHIAYKTLSKLTKLHNSAHIYRLMVAYKYHMTTTRPMSSASTACSGNLIFSSGIIICVY